MGERQARHPDPGRIFSNFQPCVEANRVGVKNQRTSDVYVTGLPGTEGLVKVEFYTPKGRDIENILKKVNKKRYQSSRLVISARHGEMSTEMIEKISERAFGKNHANPVSDLYFLQPDGSMYHFTRP